MIYLLFILFFVEMIKEREKNNLEKEELKKNLEAEIHQLQANLNKFQSVSMTLEAYFCRKCYLNYGVQLLLPLEWATGSTLAFDTQEKHSIGHFNLPYYSLKSQNEPKYHFLNFANFIFFFFFFLPATKMWLMMFNNQGYNAKVPIYLHEKCLFNKKKKVK